MTGTRKKTPRTAVEPQNVNVDDEEWNQNWLRLVMQGAEQGAIASEAMDSVLADARNAFDSMMNARPIAVVDLFRGMVFPTSCAVPPPLDVVGIHERPPWPLVDVVTAPMSAWSLSPLVAKLFAQGFSVGQEVCRGFVLMARVPVERIFSNGMTGMGNRALAEHVIIGGPMRVAISEVPR